MWSPWTVTWSLIFDQQLLSPRSYLTVGYNILPHYLLTVTIFRRNFFVTKCVLIFSTIFPWNVFIIRKERELIKNIRKSSCQRAVLLSDLRDTWIFLTDILYILLGIFPASNCSWPTFRNPLSVPSSKAGCRQCLHPAFGDETDTGFRNVCQIQFDAREIPKRIYTKFKSRRKFEI